jgi:hypothetical protein
MPKGQKFNQKIDKLHLSIRDTKNQVESYLCEEPFSERKDVHGLRGAARPSFTLKKSRRLTHAVTKLWISPGLRENNDAERWPITGKYRVSRVRLNY